MRLTKNDLNNQFKKALTDDSEYVFIGIEAEGIKEVICVPRQSLKDKQAFYNRSYTDDLVHVMNKNVRIIRLSRGASEQLNNIC